MRTFDRVIAAGGRPVERFSELVEVLEPNRGGTIPITYLRPRRIESSSLANVLALSLYEPHVATIREGSSQGEGGGDGSAGMMRLMVSGRERGRRV